MFDTSDIRIRDIQLLVELIRMGSVRELSRKSGHSPGQISKIIKGLESRLGETLLERFTLGVRPTGRALELLPFFTEVLQACENLSMQVRENVPTSITCASSSFLASHLLPRALPSWSQRADATRFRVVELPPDQLLPLGMRNVFQICLHTGDKDWPRTWIVEPVGRLNWKLVCKKKHPVLIKKSLEDVLKYPFVTPVYWAGQEVIQGNDHFQIALKKRVIGHQASTAMSALQIVLHSQHLAFLPELILRDYFATRRLFEVKVDGIQSNAMTVNLAVKADLVKNNLFEKFKKRLTEELSAV